ncbi:MAG TPA: ATP-binding protein [Catenuloplanes sp.]
MTSSPQEPMSGADGEDRRLRSDRTQLRVLLQNLIANAVKFRHPDRPCRVRVSGHTDGPGWALRVEDNGLGIPAGDRHRVTQLFTRLRPDIDGSGVGLATCQRIATAHHGQLRLADGPGGGTTVTVTLP